MEQGLRQRLLDDPAVATIVGTRVDWDVRPQRSAYPAIVLETIEGRRTQHMAGFNTFRATAVQASCFATSKAQAVAMREAVIAAIAGEATARGKRFLRAQDIEHRQRPENTGTQTIHREIVEATIWHD